MDKLGIFGGTFNPIHNGHVSLAKHYIQALGLDELLVIPTKQPPHKRRLGSGCVGLPLPGCLRRWSAIWRLSAAEKAIRLIRWLSCARCIRTPSFIFWSAAICF